MIPKQKLPITICAADTIGTLRSRKLFRVFFDSGLNNSMITTSAVTTDIGVPGSLLAGLLESFQMFACFV
jgi:hypothetical protein